MQEESVLICDDHIAILEGLQKIFLETTMFNSIYTATNYTEALKIITEKNPSVLLVDLNLGTETGFELIQKTRDQSKKTIICVFSGYHEEHFIEKAKRLGADSFISKHARPEEIISAIKTANVKSFHTVLSTNETSKPFRENDAQFSTMILLTNQEKKIIKLVLQGKTSSEIAEELSLSRFTIDTHRRNITKKTGLSGVLNLQQFAKKFNII